MLKPDLRVVGPCIVSVKIGKSVVDTDLAAGVGAAIKTTNAVAQLGSRAVPLREDVTEVETSECERHAVSGERWALCRTPGLTC